MSGFGIRFILMTPSAVNTCGFSQAAILRLRLTRQSTTYKHRTNHEPATAGHILRPQTQHGMAPQMYHDKTTQPTDDVCVAGVNKASTAC
jgi:hypothetical protein